MYSKYILIMEQNQIFRTLLSSLKIFFAWNTEHKLSVFLGDSIAVCGKSEKNLWFLYLCSEPSAIIFFQA